MSKEHIENLVEKLVQDIVTGSAVELVDVEYVKEREWYLRVFLDKEGGIEIENSSQNDAPGRRVFLVVHILNGLKVISLLIIRTYKIFGCYFFSSRKNV